MCRGTIMYSIQSVLSILVTLLLCLRDTYGQGFGPFRPFGFPRFGGGPGFGRPFPFGPPPPGISPIGFPPPPPLSFPPSPFMQPPPAFPNSFPTGFSDPSLPPISDLNGASAPLSLPTPIVEGGDPATTFETPGATQISASGGSFEAQGGIQGTTFFENQGSTNFGGVIENSPGISATLENSGTTSFTGTLGTTSDTGNLFEAGGTFLTQPGDQGSIPGITFTTGTEGNSLPSLPTSGDASSLFTSAVDASTTFTTATDSSNALAGFTSPVSDAGVPDGVNPATAAENSFAARFQTGLSGTTSGNSGSARGSVSNSFPNSISNDVLRQFAPESASGNTRPSGGFDSTSILSEVFRSGSNSRPRENPFATPNLAEPSSRDQSPNALPSLMPRTNLLQGAAVDNSILRQDNPMFGQNNVMPNSNQLGISTTQSDSRSVPETNFGRGFPAGSQFFAGGQASSSATGNSQFTPGQSGQTIPNQSSTNGGRVSNTQSTSISTFTSGSSFPNPSSSSAQSRFSGGSSASGAASSMTNTGFPNGQFNQINMLNQQTNSGQQIPFGQSSMTNVGRSEFISTSQAVQPNVVIQSNTQNMGSSSNGFPQFIGNSQINNENSNTVEIQTSATQGGVSSTGGDANQINSLSGMSGTVNQQGGVFSTNGNPNQLNSLSGFGGSVNSQRSVSSINENSNQMNGLSRFSGSVNSQSGMSSTIGNSNQMNGLSGFSGGSDQQTSFQTNVINSGFDQGNTLTFGNSISTQTGTMNFPAQTITNQTQVKIIETGQQRIVFSDQMPMENGTMRFSQMSSNTTLVNTGAQNLSVCQLRGCQTGEKCVFMNFYPCPDWIPSLQCNCLPGCTMKNRFIPRGQTITIDTCGNQCTCNGSTGQPDCTVKDCPANAM